MHLIDNSYFPFIPLLTAKYHTSTPIPAEILAA